MTHITQPSQGLLSRKQLCNRGFLFLLDSATATLFNDITCKHHEVYNRRDLLNVYHITSRTDALSRSVILNYSSCRSLRRDRSFVESLCRDRSFVESLLSSRKLLNNIGIQIAVDYTGCVLLPFMFFYFLYDIV